MNDNLQISFRGTASSDAVASRIRERAARLKRFDDRITSCRVVVQAPPDRQLFQVRIQICRPGDEVVIDRTDSQDGSHEDVYVAVHDAFEAAERRLANQTKRRNR